MTDTHTRSAFAITPRFRQRRSAGHPHVAPRGSSLTHARYLKLEGMCWVLIGAASILCSWPSLIVRETYIAPSVAAGAVVVLAFRRTTFTVGCAPVRFDRERRPPL